MAGNVYQAIAAVMADLSAGGIGKTRQNTAQGYNFRGIDDVLNALAPILSTHRLVILPRVLGRICEERETKQGGRMAYVTVDVEFDLVCAEDGSIHTIRVAGEAMDSADKATNKAMSAAYKYAAIQAFCIPTEGENDADAQTHEVKATKTAPNPGIKDAGDFLTKTLGMDLIKFNDFKAAYPDGKWVGCALAGKAAKVPSIEHLYTFLAQAPEAIPA